MKYKVFSYIYEDQTIRLLTNVLLCCTPRCTYMFTVFMSACVGCCRGHYPCGQHFTYALVKLYTWIVNTHTSICLLILFERGIPVMQRQNIQGIYIKIICVKSPGIVQKIRRSGECRINELSCDIILVQFRHPFIQLLSLKWDFGNISYTNTHISKCSMHH